LIEEKEVFAQLQAVPQELEKNGAIGTLPENTSSSTGIAPGGMAAVSIVAVGAVMLSVIASVYYVRQ
jgi:hypothetical protein